VYGALRGHCMPLRPAQNVLKAVENQASAKAGPFEQGHLPPPTILNVERGLLINFQHRAETRAKPNWTSGSLPCRYVPANRSG
jgi:hypothetical protein